MSVMSVRGRALRCTLYVELCCLVSLGVPQLLAQGETAAVHLRPVTALTPAQDSVRGQPWGAAAEQRITLELHDVALKDALRAIATQGNVVLFYNDRDIPAERRVSLVVTDATVTQALHEVLRGTGLSARVTAGGIVLEPRAPTPQRPEMREQQGTIRGTVTDSTTGAPVGGATVAVSDGEPRTVTGADGGYRLASVPAGTITLTVQRLGYAPTSRQITVVADSETVVDVRLVPAPQMLDEVVTTGTVVPTEVKALPTPITVINGADIARQHPHSIQELFRQAVPSAVSWDFAAYPYQTAFSVRGASTLSPGVAQMKVFIDGTEAAFPTAAGIDPNSIARVEVVRGPEAAAIYGADASGGVIQIFTKHGDIGLTRPQVDAQVALGMVQTPYVGYERVPRQTYAASLSGGGSDVSYSVGAGYSHTGDYVSAVSAQSNPSVHGGMHFAHGITTIDISGQYDTQQNPQAYNPAVIESGLVSYSKPFYLPFEVQTQRVGTRIHVAPTTWWQHTLTMGIDRLTETAEQTQPRLTTPADTLLEVLSFDYAKTSLGYNTSVQGALGAGLTGSLTAGFDYYNRPATSWFTFSALATAGPIQTAPSGAFTINRYTTRNTGYFTQFQLAVHDALFVTGGLRGDQNTDFGADVGTRLSPQMGISYVHAIGAVTLKLRGSYGRAIRAPGAGLKFAAITPAGDVLANPRLGPERQQGGDAGLDVTFGSRSSLSATYYNQIADDLIQQVPLQSDSVPTSQYQNVGRVKNAGIELEGSVTVGPMLVKGQYGYTRSRIERLAPGYTGDLRVGDQSLWTPKHTGGMSLSLAPRQGTSITAGLTYVGSWTYYDVLGELRCFGKTGPCQPTSRDYLTTYPGFAKVNLTISQQLTQFISAFLSLDNLTNSDAYEATNINPVMGRITTIGVRFQY